MSPVRPFLTETSGVRKGSFFLQRPFLRGTSSAHFSRFPFLCQVEAGQKGPLFFRSFGSRFFLESLLDDGFEKR